MKNTSCSIEHRQLLHGRASFNDQKVADCRFDYRTGNAVYCYWERRFKFIFHWGEAVNLLLWPSQTKDLLTEPKKVICVGVVG